MKLLSFDDLTETEAALVRAALAGDVFEAPRGVAMSPSKAPQPEEWGPERTVRAEVIRQLITGDLLDPSRQSTSPSSSRIARAHRVRVVGDLDLQDTRTSAALGFQACWFDSPHGPNLHAAELASLRLIDCWLPSGLQANQLRTAGDLVLSRTRFDAEVQLMGARIGGQLVMEGTTIRVQAGDSLSADSARIDGGLYANELHTYGTVRLHSATISGQLVMTKADLHGANSESLVADGLQANGDAFFDRMHANGTVRLFNAQVSGQIALRSATLHGDAGFALLASGLRVGGGMDFGGMSEPVIVGRPGGGIGFELDLGATGCVASGGVNLAHSRVGGEVVMTGAKLRHTNGDALMAARAQFDGGVTFGWGFESEGVIRLVSARIGGQLVLDGAKLASASGPALVADGAIIEGKVSLGPGLDSSGEVRFVGARVTGPLFVQGASLQAAAAPALNADRIEVTDVLTWRPLKVVGTGQFRWARTNVWEDDRSSLQFPVALEGLRYDAVHPGAEEIRPAERAAWLGRDPFGYSPSPYAQLATILRSRGHETAAREILIASQRARRARGPKGLSKALRAIGSALSRWTIGYGYRPARALPWLIGLFVVATLFIDRCLDGAKGFSAAGDLTPFRTWAYLLDVIVPFVSLGYDRWSPTGASLIAVLVVVVLGWTLVTALVASLAGFLRRGD